MLLLWLLQQLLCMYCYGCCCCGWGVAVLSADVIARSLSRMQFSNILLLSSGPPPSMVYLQICFVLNKFNSFIIRS